MCKTADVCDKSILNIKASSLYSYSFTAGLFSDSNILESLKLEKKGI